jgi:hypothetical protein
MDKRRKRISWIIVVMLVICFSGLMHAQQPYRVGTTTANFLEIGMGAAGNAMGEAYVGSVKDVTAMYWNPAGLAFLESSEARFIYHPWIVNTGVYFAGAGLVLPGVGSLGISFSHFDFGEEEVTTLDYPDGLGENYSAGSMSIGVTYARSLTNWFSFGSTFKYISQNIWHMSANALALDLGVIVNTNLFSPTGKNDRGLVIAMSISNYGTRMQYTGLDALMRGAQDVDQVGVFNDVKTESSTDAWELPLIFRLGFAYTPIQLANQRVTLAADALHPNNNKESLNLGMEYMLRLMGSGEVFLRGGYKGIFLEEYEFGPTFGAGVLLTLSTSLTVKIDYAYKYAGLFGNAHCSDIALTF